MRRNDVSLGSASHGIVRVVLACAVVVLISNLLPGRVSAAQDEVGTLTIDLAGPAKFSRHVVPDKKYRLVVRNVAPGRRYEYEIRRVVHAIEPLPMQEGTTPKVHTAGVPPKGCPDLRAALGRLLDENLREEDVAPKAAAVEEQLESCIDPELQITARDVLSRSSIDLGLSEVARGEVVTVTITRAGRSWVASLDGGERGVWLGSYGFVYSPTGGEQYFAKAVEGGKYQITKQHDPQGWDFAPLALYSWIPASSANRDVSVGLTGGVGFTNDRPTVALGASLFYNRNLGVTVGGLMRTVSQLNRNYDPDVLPVVSENLSADQLHTWNYQPTLFVAVTFRFNESPFSKDPDRGAAEGTRNKEPDSPESKSTNGKVPR